MTRCREYEIDDLGQNVLSLKSRVLEFGLYKTISDLKCAVDLLVEVSILQHPVKSSNGLFRFETQGTLLACEEAGFRQRFYFNEGLRNMHEQYESNG